MATRPSSCRMLVERLSACIDGDLPAAEQHRVEAHARRCPRCRRELDELRRATGLCRKAGTRPLPPAVRKLAQEHVRRMLRETAPAASRAHHKSSLEGHPPVAKRRSS